MRQNLHKALQIWGLRAEACSLEYEREAVILYGWKMENTKIAEEGGYLISLKKLNIIECRIPCDNVSFLINSPNSAHFRKDKIFLLITERVLNACEYFF